MSESFPEGKIGGWNPPSWTRSEPAAPAPDDRIAPGSSLADVERHLERLERMVAEARTVPLSASIMLNRPEVQELLVELRQTLPATLREARWLVRERDELLDRAQRDAGDIVEQAQQERARLIAKTEVVQAASREADRIIDEAHEHARQMRLEAEDYVDAKLANFEVVLHKTLAAVRRGREKLRGRLDSDELAEPDLEEDDLE